MRRPSTFERLFVVIALLFYGGALFPFLQDATVGEAVNTEGSLTSQLIYLIIYLITFYYSFTYLGALKNALSSNKELLLLFALAVVSIAWSDDAAVTSRRVFALLCTSLFGYYLAVRYTLVDMLRLLTQSLTIAGVLSVMAAVALPAYGLMGAMQEGGYHEGAWKGVYIHKNTLGRLMVINTLTAYTLYRYTKDKRYWLIITLAVFLIVMSRSSSALVLVILIIGFANLLKTFQLKGPGLVLMLLSLPLLLGLLGYYAIMNYELLFEYLGKDATLTGRTLLWEQVLEAIGKRPILGHGFSGFWLGEHSASAVIIQQLNWEVPNAHNGFLDILLDLGYAGMACFLVLHIGSLFSFMKQFSLYRQSMYSWGVEYLLLFLFYNFLESNALRQNSFMWLVFVATVSSYSLQQAAHKFISRKPITAVPILPGDYLAVTVQ